MLAMLARNEQDPGVNIANLANIATPETGIAPANGSNIADIARLANKKTKEEPSGQRVDGLDAIDGAPYDAVTLNDAQPFARTP